MMNMKLYDLGHGIYTRGRTNRLSHEHKAWIAAGKNIRGVFCLAPRADPDTSWVKGYHHHPIPDGKVTPEMTMRLDLMRSMAQGYMAKGEAILINCNAGRNRAILLAALVLHDTTQMSMGEIITHVRTVRPNALANPHFVAYLRTLP